MPEGDAPKLIVDTDWKTQARAEKDRLAEAAPPAGKPSPGRGAAAGPDGQPPVDFSELVRMLASQALMYLGGIPEPETGRRMVALDVGRLYIDLLGVLQDKTKGNLSAEEQRTLDEVVHELRLQYVAVAKAVDKAIADQAANPGAAAGVTPTLKMPPKV